MLKVVAVTREDLARGFSLTGLDVILADPVKQAGFTVVYVTEDGHDGWANYQF